MRISDWSSDVCSSDLIIIRGGENISCPEVEAAIYAHPDVQECAVFGLPDERLGEVVGAAVWLTPDSKTDATLLATFLSEHLAPFKVPAKIWLADAPLPKLGSEKIDKVSLRNRDRKSTRLNSSHYC